ncbi:MAG: FAD-binding protein [Alphaproteobacteria bacterium]|nr:FAD-binding protein [Alphaproteobacteria bacterium]MCY4229729.1 FAD-binding protein [Alphaproteobacteria bacterium]
MSLTVLREHFGARFSAAEAVRRHHGKDATFHTPHLPDAVVFAETVEDVQAVVRACHESGTPVVPFGAGTSLEGHIGALNGGVTVDLTGLDRIRAIHQDDMTCFVEPGVTRKQLNRELRATGLFFPIDPGADASLGGMVATGASGTNAVRYGTMRENVLSLEVVLPDGQLIETGTRARKSSAGYDLTRLYIGSEGTLGIVTGIHLRLYGIPESIASAVCAFPTVNAAVDAVILIIQSGIPVARIELLDEMQMEACNRYSKLDYALSPHIFFEFHGTAAGVAEQAEATGAIAQEFGGSDFAWSTTTEKRNRLWQARHDAFFAAIALRPGAEGWPTDVCVPLSRLAECIAETRTDLMSAPFPTPIVGHVGDGNFHVIFVIDTNVAEEVRIATELNDRLVRRALAMGGTCTGEHGVGYGKMHFLEAEHPSALPFMRVIKRALDPKNIMNPGKIVRL